MPRSSPKDTAKRLFDTTQAWESLRPGKSYAGLTLDQFKEAVKPSHDARAELADLDDRVQGAIARREVADAQTMSLIQRVVYAVKADPEEGEDSALYAAMGYVRKSARSRGLTRRRNTESGGSGEATPS